jgi:hypothetical protein
MLRTLVERHLKTWRIPPTRFGRDVVGDPRFVFDLREGREPRLRTEMRVRAHIAAFEQGRRQ